MGGGGGRWERKRDEARSKVSESSKAGTGHSEGMGMVAIVVS